MAGDLFGQLLIGRPGVAGDLDQTVARGQLGSARKGKPPLPHWKAPYEAANLPPPGTRRSFGTGAVPCLHRVRRGQCPGSVQQLRPRRFDGIAVLISAVIGDLVRDPEPLRRYATAPPPDDD